MTAEKNIGSYKGNTADQTQISSFLAKSNEISQNNMHKSPPPKQKIIRLTKKNSPSKNLIWVCFINLEQLADKHTMNAFCAFVHSCVLDSKPKDPDPGLLSYPDPAP